MAKIFESLRMRKPRYSAFDLSHEKKLSFEMGKLIPILHEEIVPGDHFKVSTELMLRMPPMIAPVMHRINVFVHYFFVPNRIIWTSWEDFITGGQDGTSTPTMPTITHNSQTDIGTLGDYLGVGGIIAGGVYNPELNALPFRAYQQIFNDYYRDPNIDAEVDITSESAAASLRTRRWEKDYFTSCLPWSQRGPQVTIDGEITYKDDAVRGSGNIAGGTNVEVNPGYTAPDTLGSLNAGGSNPITLENIDSLGITIEELRASSRLQEWLETNARGGYRYIEQLLSHFGVKSSDARLQRPEYLGGGRQPIVISEVLNTSATATEAQGTMAGHGVSVGQSMSARRRFEEHGQLLGIMSVLPRTVYSQGIPRKFLRTDKLDYYFPEFANLGEQEVQSMEVYFNSGGAESSNTQVFGYQQRYAEYKYGCSTVHGEFRDTLDFWHMAREFTSRPTLDNVFLAADPTTRIFAVPSEPELYCQVFNSVKARRPMPYFSNPNL